MTKTKIKVVDGKKNKKTVGELGIRDAFVHDERYWVKTDDTSKNNEYAYCFCLCDGGMGFISLEYVPKIVYRKMKVKLYE